MKKDSLFLVSQVITLIGSELTRFVLPIWVFQETRSNTLLGFLSLAAFIPRVFIGPYSGTIVDKYDAKKIILWSDFSQMLGTLVILISFWMLNKPNIYVLGCSSFLTGIANTFQFSALSKILPYLTEKGNIARVNAGLTAVERVSQLFSPIMSGILLTVLTIDKIMIIDIVTYFIGTLLMKITLNKIMVTTNSEAQIQSVWKLALEGIKFCFSNSKRISLLSISSISNLCFSVSFTYFPALLLISGLHQDQIGYVYSLAAAFQIAGSVYSGRVSAPINLLKAQSYLMLFISILSFFSISIYPKVPIIIASFLILMTVLPVINVWSRICWYDMTPDYLHGRVFATRRSVSSILGMIGFLCSGPILDWIQQKTKNSLFAYQSSFGLAGALMFISCSLIILVAVGNEDARELS